jgi:hypothetical protein
MLKKSKRSKIIFCNATLLDDNKTPSKSFREGQLHGEECALPQDIFKENPSHFLYHLKETQRGVEQIFDHLSSSEKIKISMQQEKLEVHEAFVWHGAPLNNLAWLFGRRLSPALLTVSVILDDQKIFTDFYEWFTGEWLPKADATASSMRMMDRIFSRTRPVAHICKLLMDEFKLKFYELISNINTRDPKLLNHVYLSDFT